MAQFQRNAMTKVLSASVPASKRPGLFKRFLKNTSGSLTPMMGLAAIPFILAAGAAIDMSRVNREQASFYQAIDGAALAVAADDRSALEGLSVSEQETRRAQLEVYAKQYVESNYKNISGSGVSLDIDLSITGKEIKIDGTLDFPMTFMQLAGVTHMELKESTTVNKAMKPIELVMVLDTTGSMKNDMDDLKDAAHKLLSTLYQDTGGSPTPSSEFIRIALVPFSGAVRLDTNAHDFDLNWIDTTGANPLSKINFNDATWNNYMAWGKLKKDTSNFHTWNGCVEARKYGTTAGDNYISGDQAPTSGDQHSKFPAYFNPDSPSWNSGGSNTAYRTNGTSYSGNWGNKYINAYANYTTGSPNSSLLAPSGSRRTGYDDSTIGNNNNDFNTRYTNVAKYDGAIVNQETLSLSGVTWSVNSGPWVGCTASKIVPMTYNRSRVDSGIDSMKAYASTNIAEGLAWGMRAVSPGAPFTKVEGYGSIANTTIAPYNGPRWQKIMVLMSDGDNDPCVGCNYTDTGSAYNALGRVNVPTAGGLNRYGTTSLSSIEASMDANTTAMCTQLKNAGVTLYTVGYRLDSTLLRNCATSNAHYKYAATPADLVAFFDHIGAETLNKMVYVSK
jgi:Flp pilus assembly protein TadG